VCEWQGQISSKARIDLCLPLFDTGNGAPDLLRPPPLPRPAPWRPPLVRWCSWRACSLPPGWPSPAREAEKSCFTRARSAVPQLTPRSNTSGPPPLALTQARRFTAVRRCGGIALRPAQHGMGLARCHPMTDVRCGACQVELCNRHQTSHLRRTSVVDKVLLRDSQPQSLRTPSASALLHIWAATVPRGACCPRPSVDWAR